MEFANAKRLLSRVRRAVEKYEMIEKNDGIAVALSGGKDSLSLLAALAELRRFYAVPFSLRAVTVDPGFGADFAPMRSFCEALDVSLLVVPAPIREIVFDARGEKNPCALCAKIRRAALVQSAKDLGCAKLALGHHADDAVVTFMMNLMNEGRVGCFSPVTFLEDAGVTVIRPLVMTRESEIGCFVKNNALPVAPSLCPVDKHTAREDCARLLRGLEKENKGLMKRLYTALEKGEIDGFRS